MRAECSGSVSVCHDAVSASSGSALLSVSVSRSLSADSDLGSCWWRHYQINCKTVKIILDWE